MLQVGGELDLLLEPRGADFTRELRGKQLDHHRPVERSLGGEKQAAHPAATQLLFDPVGVTDRTLQASQQVAHECLRYRSAHARASRARTTDPSRILTAARSQGMSAMVPATERPRPPGRPYGGTEQCHKQCQRRRRGPVLTGDPRS